MIFLFPNFMHIRLNSVRHLILQGMTELSVSAAPAPGPLPLPLSGVGAVAAFWDGRAETADAEDVVGADAPGDDGPAGTDDSRCPGGSGAPLGVGGIG